MAPRLLAVLIRISLMTNDAERRFMFVGHVSIFFGEKSIQVLYSFLNQVLFLLLLSFRSSLHILSISPLLDISSFFMYLFLSVFSLTIC